MQNWAREKKASKSFERPRDVPIMPTEAQAVPAAEKWVQVSERGAVPQGKNDMVTEMSQPKKKYISPKACYSRYWNFCTASYFWGEDGGSGSERNDFGDPSASTVWSDEALFNLNALNLNDSLMRVTLPSSQSRRAAAHDCETGRVIHLTGLDLIMWRRRRRRSVR